MPDEDEVNNEKEQSQIVEGFNNEEKYTKQNIIENSMSGREYENKI